MSGASRIDIAFGLLLLAVLGFAGCSTLSDSDGADDSQNGVFVDGGGSGDNGSASGGGDDGNGTGGGGGSMGGGSETGAGGGGDGDGDMDTNGPIAQWASRVIAVSSQFGDDGWSGRQALGEPDVFVYGDVLRAWAPEPQNGSEEFIAVGFDTPVFATGAMVRETFGNGMVIRIEAIGDDNISRVVWEGEDPSQPGEPVDFSVDWEMTDYVVSGLRIHVDTDTNLGTWEEIDAIELRGISAD